jgi:hypothetical protein
LIMSTPKRGDEVLLWRTHVGPVIARGVTGNSRGETGTALNEEVVSKKRERERKQSKTYRIEYPRRFGWYWRFVVART